MQSRCLFTKNNYYISVFCKQLMVRRYIVSNIVNTLSKFYLAYIRILIIWFYEYKLLLKTEDLFRS
jgi:hypothetical protein